MSTLPTLPVLLVDVPSSLSLPKLLAARPPLHSPMPNALLIRAPLLSFPLVPLHCHLLQKALLLPKVLLQTPSPTGSASNRRATSLISARVWVPTDDLSVFHPESHESNRVSIPITDPPPPGPFRVNTSFDHPDTTPISFITNPTHPTRALRRPLSTTTMTTPKKMMTSAATRRHLQRVQRWRSLAQRGYYDQEEESQDQYQPCVGNDTRQRRQKSRSTNERVLPRTRSPQRNGTYRVVENELFRAANIRDLCHCSRNHPLPF